MSPEQASGEALDGRSDLYAVGIVLWELLTLERLRVGPPGDVEATAFFQAIRRPSEHRPGIPTDLEAVAMRLLAPDRAERYPTAPRDGRGELARFLEERFPRPPRQDPSSRSPEPGTSSASRWTVTNPRAAMDAPPSAAAGARVRRTDRAGARAGNDDRQDATLPRST
jgi:serine/threonine protein kinase